MRGADGVHQGFAYWGEPSAILRDGDWVSGREYEVTAMSPRAMQVAVDIGENLGPEDENGRNVGSFWQPSAHAVNVMIDDWYNKQAELRLESDLGV